METRGWWRQVGRAVVLAVAVSIASAPVARAGVPVAGVDAGAAIPTDKTQRTVDTGGMIAPYVGYRLGDTFAVAAELQPQFVAFPTGNVPDPGSDVTSLFVLTSGLRFSMIDENKEVFFKIHGGLYHSLTGPLEQTKGGFAIAGGFNYDITPSTALGIFLRRDESSIQAAAGTHANFTYLSTGLALTYRVLPAPPAPPPPAPVVAQAPPPPPPVKKKIVLRGVNFDFDKSNVRGDAAPVLDEAVNTLKEASSITIAVEGHTDSMGSDEYNQGLSERRANAVRDYLAGHGIDKSRMTTEGFGESRPVATNDTDEGRAQNRRVELRVTSE
ncbi:MAG TPA: OmpA family protein [Candidatus Binatia bacterium]|nr:OmpA family protein [Candidatus Binatia bacterium]